MTPERRQRLLLVLLAGVIAVFAVRSLGGGRSVGEAFGIAGRDGVDLSSRLDTEVAELHLERLAAQTGELEPGRNPWRFERVAPPRRPDPEPAPEPVIETEPVAVEPIPREPPKPKPPAIDLEYLGSFGPDRRKIAVFADGETLINALVGDVLKSKFRVHAIGYESVDLTFEGFPDEPPARLPIREG